MNLEMTGESQGILLMAGFVTGVPVGGAVIGEPVEGAVSCFFKYVAYVFAQNAKHMRLRLPKMEIRMVMVAQPGTACPVMTQ